MHIAVELVALVVVVASVAGLAERFGASPPLALVVVGVIGSFIPGVPELKINPEVILTGLLPPLLYASALRMSFVDIKRNRRPIMLLSIGLVAFSTAVIGVVTWWLIPAISVAAAFALGAVVAPPDAVAASAVGRRVGMPRRTISILEGESLFNDATSLVALNTAIAAITRDITVGEVAARFLLAAVGGIVIGIAVATVLGYIRKHIDEPVLDTTLSFVAPYVAFVPAEAVHSSGVVAVVITGLLLSHTAPRIQSATSRISESLNWSTIQFILENLVFLLIGLQLRDMLRGVRDSGDSFALVTTTCVAVLLACMLARVVWVFAACGAYKIGPPKLREQAWSWSTAAVISWCGMRGVVTLAAVFLLPDSIPQLPLLKLTAFTVVAGTLLIQGLTLPMLVRRLGLQGPDAADDALQAASLVSEATRAGLDRLEEIRQPSDPEEVIEQLRARAASRSNQAWERLGRSESELEPPSVTYRRLRVQMLAAERDTILDARDSGTVDYPVLRAAMAAVDVEESLLDRLESADSRLGEDLVARPSVAGECGHLREAPRAAVQQTPGACAECLEEGTNWVHLRMCLSCGHVGCCDSSVGLHAEAHFRQTGHPVMRSVEPGEAWRWCYLDEQLG
ncbi:sodium/proton antiporter (CPA1 family) [Jatrophihabitans sp. GAS493]|uniref:Na+/H+ antiporter n=1 Tax=Jatrophihabitans sp. GAS493 TaxID=1907575 RepID=UPI000BB8353B|nr:Na+/H+ antiporter [Jatrophihabitans sp. GAS493]SOD70460.1 sodium/proton antiporter (CPA1 family) [Jatrophihabitans sp. GAS493]